MDETARELRKLASRLPKYLYLIPLYTVMARIFRLPFRAEILAASKALKGLANGIHKSTDGVNAKYVKTVCESLRIYHEPCRARMANLCGDSAAGSATPKHAVLSCSERVWYVDSLA
jgi:hypothetical protein